MSGGLLATKTISQPAQASGQLMTVLGEIPVSNMGKTLIHEHLLVDFIGADKTGYERWDRSAVIKKVWPYLQEVKKAGVQTFFDCTPAFLGRDPRLLQELAQKTGLHIITNTGYYGAVNNKYLPAWAHDESAEQLAQRWIKECKEGIEDTGIKPGFIKISVNEGPLSDLHRKLVRAAGITHTATGLTICSHTGKAPAAFEQLEVLQKMNVPANAFVWVHAQAEKDKTLHTKAAKLGAWVSLDGIGWGDFEQYADSMVRLKEEGLLHRVLISHDAGWYRPGEPEGGKFTGFTNIFTQLFPLLNKKGFTLADHEQLLVKNPAAAFAIGIKTAG
jgi:phosphotriesterase-related protein